ncbi:MAG: YqaJ viral recombinase family protein [Oscillospiraceae bacterium]|nr:YqaJ viral recombinase family protein [Oscillospiraceae bacterium]MBQ8378050.1 YqaJ viral recombinase family protein [Oscillospiraceae bacterium]
MITTVSTAKMSHAEWLKHRKKAIGGSDAPTIVGLNHYSSPYELWAEKLGRIPPKEENEAMRLGHDLEDYVAKRFCEKKGKKVRRKKAMIYNSHYPFAHANVDRLVVGEDAGLECKTTSALNMKKFKNGEYPANYYVQCQHYMMVTGLKKWYLAVLVLGKEFLVFEIERNEDDIEALAQAESYFWDLVKSKTPPAVDGSNATTEALGTIYKESAESNIIVDLTPLKTALLIRNNAKAQISELEKLVAEKENEIKSYMGENPSGECDGFVVSWKTQDRTIFDKKAFAKSRPDIRLDAFMKTSTSRPFKVSKI